MAKIYSLLPLVLSIVVATILLVSSQDDASTSLLNALHWPAVTYHGEAVREIGGVIHSIMLDDGLHIYHILLMATAVLLLGNTFVYVNGITTSAEQALTRDPASSRKRRIGLGLMQLSLLLIGLWGFEIYLGFVSRNLSPYLQELEHEVIALALFVVFGIGDLLLHRVYSKEADDAVHSEKDRSSLRRRAREYLLQLVLVDLPVVLGVLAILLADHSMAQLRSAFLLGFRAGGLVVHLVFSQVVFVTLTLFTGRLLVLRQAAAPAGQPIRKET